MKFIYRYSALRLIYWFLRAPFSPYAAYRYACEILARKVSRFDGTGFEVLCGPFAGLKHTRSGSGVNLPCILGTYELEIHRWIESAIASKYDTVVDVGSAEGYYACGFAKRMGARILAFDISQTARNDCKEMARINAVDHLVRIGESLSPEGLEQILPASEERYLIFCDIEGAELDLLDPIKAPRLRHTDLIVEIHGDSRQNTLAEILRRFSESHSYEIADRRPRYFDQVLEEFPILKSLYAQHAEAMIIGITETRGFNSWVFLRARAN